VRELTERDRKLFNYAKKEISKESSKLNILNAKICIEFHDRDVCVISKGGEEIGGQCIRIVMDNDGECTTVWEKQWFCRRVCQTVINADLTPVKNIAITYLPVLIAFGMRQMGWRQT
jgi:hypothetical protein